MKQEFQNIIDSLNSEVSGLGDNLINYLKNELNIDFNSLDTSTQVIILTVFDLGYRVGSNFKISIDIRGPKQDHPLDVQVSADSLLFEDL